MLEQPIACVVASNLMGPVVRQISPFTPCSRGSNRFVQFVNRNLRVFHTRIAGHAFKIKAMVSGTIVDACQHPSGLLGLLGVSAMRACATQLATLFSPPSV
jgi:hypothetical protein